MANPQNPHPQSSPRPGKPSPSVDEQNRKHRNASNEPVEGNEDESVEIGDPVPENDRTIKASRTSPGETGEDEDLPDDEDGIEGRGGPH